MNPAAYRPQARKPRGFPDRRAGDLALESWIIQRACAIFELWGYEHLDTGAFEFADVLGKFLPDADRPNAGVFALQDDDNQWLSLRYDLTAPLARFVAEHFDQLPKPYKRFAAGPVWRNEKPGPGRFREFLQCDADMVGILDPASDAEMVAMMAAAYEAIGLRETDYRIRISSRKLLNGLMAGLDIAQDDTGDARRLIVLRAMDKLDRLGIGGVGDLLQKGRRDESGDFTRGADLSSQQADSVIAFLTADQASPDRGQTLAALATLIGNEEGQAGLEELATMDRVLDNFALSGECVRFDPSVVRGLEYYTGPVFEAELIAQTTREGLRAEGDAPMASGGASLGSIGGGGRYDDLVSRFRGESIPATGFSIGVSRLAAALRARDAQNAARKGPVVILSLDPALQADYFAMAQELRGAGIASDVYLGRAGLKAQMKYADRRAARVVILLGADEKDRGEITLKDLDIGAAMAQGIDDHSLWRSERPGQFSGPRSELVAMVQNVLARSNPAGTP